MVEEVTLGQVFSQSTSVFLFKHSFINVSYPYSSTRCCYQEVKRSELGNLPKNNTFRKLGNIKYKNLSLSFPERTGYFSVNIFVFK
jgi:hypothetical protein